MYFSRITICYSCYRLSAPYVSISSASVTPDQAWRVGSYAHPAFVPHPDLSIAPPLSLQECITNVAYNLVTYAITAFYTQRQQALVSRLVDAATPPLGSIAHNASLLIVNTHHSMLLPRPVTPNYIEVGGLHIHPAKLLDKVITIKRVNMKNRQVVTKRFQGELCVYLRYILNVSMLH